MHGRRVVRTKTVCRAPEAESDARSSGDAGRKVAEAGASALVAARSTRGREAAGKRLGLTSGPLPRRRPVSDDPLLPHAVFNSYSSLDQLAVIPIVKAVERHRACSRCKGAECLASATVLP